MKYKSNRKTVLLTVAITTISYFLLIFFFGGFTQIQLYNKYNKLSSEPKEFQETLSSTQDNQVTEAAKRRAGIFGFVDSINREVKVNKPIATKGFAESQKIEDNTFVAKDLTEYRPYVDNPNPDDPNLDNKMVKALKISIYESWGYSTLLAVIIFILSLTLINKSNNGSPLHSKP